MRQQGGRSLEPYASGLASHLGVSVEEALAEIRRQGRAGRGVSKVRGDSDHYREMGTRKGRYCVSWAWSEGAPEPPADLPTSATLGRVIRLCRDHGLSARLTDEAGFARGRVHADGSYSLS